MQIQRLSPDAKKAMKLAKDKHWGFRVLDGNNTIDTPFYRREWWYLPVDETDSTIPKRALERVRILKSNGIRIKGMVVAHEAPTLLKAPKKQRAQAGKPRETKEKAATSTSLAEVLGVFFQIFGFIAMAALLDPALIVILEDGTFVEVMRWYE